MRLGCLATAVCTWSQPARLRPGPRGRARLSGAGRASGVAPLARSRPIGIEALAWLEGCARCLSMGRDGTAGGARLVLVVWPVQCLASALDALLDLLEACGERGMGAGARLGVDRLALAAVASAECTREEV